MRQVWVSPRLPWRPSAVQAELGDAFEFASGATINLDEVGEDAICVVSVFEHETLRRLANRSSAQSLVVVAPPQLPVGQLRVDGRPDVVTAAARVSDVADAVRRAPSPVGNGSRSPAPAGRVAGARAVSPPEVPARTAPPAVDPPVVSEAASSEAPEPISATVRQALTEPAQPQPASTSLPAAVPAAPARLHRPHPRLVVTAVLAAIVLTVVSVFCLSAAFWQRVMDVGSAIWVTIGAAAFGLAVLLSAVAWWLTTRVRR